MDDVREVLSKSISDRELERRWKEVRERMEQEKIDFLVMQNDNEWLGGYVKWFTDVPARNAQPHTVIFDPHGEEYQKALEPEFPDLVIRVCKTEEEVRDFIEQARILLTFNISDELSKKAANLQWIQAPGRGVD